MKVLPSPYRLLVTTPKPQSTNLFGEPLVGESDAAFIAAYEACGLTLDDLPYTDAFASLAAQVGAGKSHAEVFRKLHNLRKAGKLPRLGRSATPAIKVNEEEEKYALDAKERNEIVKKFFFQNFFRHNGFP